MKTNSLDFDAQALREKILDLAMRGKLVKQDPNDEPASVLLEKIKAEKAELVKEGKIKKSKALPEITDEEKPFDIPDSWEWVRLGDVATFISGKTEKAFVKNPKINAVYFKISDMNFKENKYFAQTSQKSIRVSGKEQFIPKGSILFPKRGGAIKTNKKRIVNCNNMVIDMNLMAITPILTTINDWIYYWFSMVKLENISNGSNVPQINNKDIESLMFPLPPVSEQSRIAAKIAQLFALLRKVESSTQQYAKLQTLLKSKVLDLAMRGKLVEQDPNDEPASVLLEKIKAEKEQLIKEKKVKRSKPLPPISDEEKPFEIPDSWEWVRLGDVGLIATGNTPTKNNSDFYGGTTPFIKPADIQNLIINYNTKDFLSEKGEQKGRLAYKNDILVTCIGNLGRNNIINRKVAYNQQINGISPLIVSSSLLHYFMLSSFFISSMYNYASATTLPILNKTKLSNLIIPLPPLAEQSRIVDKIEMIFSLFCKDESSTQQYENL
ncbi:restriction endonuclease subunit S [Lactobacillus johnsonii]|uniref:restriction endonuclease subunit S n=1 Tax=Lactobacillus johnsonii TaxID=33959 RepID=UPI00177D41B6|nr:restriction endonuclease subunit S [Lactobacillus johnsonii]QXL46953.1 restriction endonuclease subunit S [Lactobacillus johnsonii]WNW29208.1 restriction endonuclease subunit S [Lactobacillus johnsonii]